MRRDLEARGTAIGMGDSLIAGIAANAVLLTRNIQHFEKVAGLRLSGRYHE